MKPTLIAIALLLTSSLAFAADAPAVGTPGGLPPGEKEAKAAVDQKSPRHGEWVKIEVPGEKTPVKSFIVYPEAKDKAPVVIVIQEIFGLTDWIRGVADQLAADGFIAIAPDLLSGHGKDGGGTETFDPGSVRQAVSGLNADEVNTRLNAVRAYGMKLPSSNGKTATIGFCWGGGKSFAYAVAQPDLNAAVVYYGTPPAKDALPKVKAAVAGFYGGNDNRITATVEPTKAEMKTLDKIYEPHVFAGAGHGFLRQQDGQDGANMKATQEAWPATIKFLREHTK
jgi:carboxymethylenebutenolidase